MLKTFDYANRFNFKYVVGIYLSIAGLKESKTIIFMISIKHDENVIIADQIKWSSPGASWLRSHSFRWRTVKTSRSQRLLALWLIFWPIAYKVNSKEQRANDKQLWGLNGCAKKLKRFIRIFISVCGSEPLVGPLFYFPHTHIPLIVTR